MLNLRDTAAWWRRPVGAVAAVLLLASMLTIAPTPPLASADTTTQITKEAPGDVLVGEPVRFTIDVAAPADNDTPLFNGTLRDVLPVGMTYVGGSTEPATVGDPQVVTNEVEIAPGQTRPQQTLLWVNIGDLQPASSFSLSFQAQPVAEDFPVGSSFTNQAEGYSSTNPRRVPRFDDQGELISDPAVTEAASNTTTTQVTAIEVAKSEPSPEGELLRGVHDQTTVYTLQVRNNTLAATDGVTLVDWVPAGLEYLGCGGVDNTPAGSPATVGGVEYPGAPALTGTPGVGADCLLPDRVETVDNPTGPGVPAGLTGTYTQLSWTIGDLAPGDEVTVRYAAGIPLRANTSTFASGTTPTPESLGQTANLDNNTGPSTRETGSEISLTNVAQVSGTYTGLLEPGFPAEVSNTDDLTRTAEDLAMRKRVNPTEFAIGAIATYTLDLQVSEYVDAGSIVVTDVMPNGVCPLSSDQNYVSGAPTECGPEPGTDPTGAGFAGVQQNADGTFTLTFTDVQIEANGTARITYQGRMRSVYTGGDLAGLPPTAGDTFTNRASLAGVTTPIDTAPPGTGETGPQTVGDTSQATQTTSGASINKTIKPRQFPYECDGDSDEFVESGFPDRAFVFRKGDRICFELEVVFPANVDTRNPVITDFIPDGTSYEAGSQFLLPSNDVVSEFNEPQAASGAQNPTWTLGTELQDSGNFFVLRGSVWRARFSVVVDRPANGDEVDISGNLMKGRGENNAGQGVSFRDELPLGIAPAPDVGIVKGVQSVTSGADTVVLDPTPPGAPGNDVDDVQVRQTDEVTYRVDVTNTGDPDASNDVSVRGWQVWDVLPAGITCADVVPGSISPTGVIAATSPPDPNPASPAGQCTDPGDADHPTFAERDTQSAIRWQASDGLDADPTDAPVPGDGSQISTDETRTLAYTVRIPDEVAVSTVFDNTVSVRSFNAFTNEFGETTTFFPAENVDTTVDPIDATAPAATDPSSVFVPDAALTKVVIATGVSESNNNNTDNGDAPAERGQATNGETATFRVGVTIPAQTSVYQASLTDSLPGDLTFLAATAAFSPTGQSPATDPLPDGFGFDGTTGEVTFPTTYTNDTDSDQRVEVEILAGVTPRAGGNNSVKANTARFVSFDAPTGGTALPALTDTAGVQVVFPNPRLTKTNVAEEPVEAGSQVTYRLRVSNAVNRPPLHDAVVVDCLPDGLTFVEFTTLPTGATTTEPGTGANGCAADSTRIEWTLQTPVLARQAFEAFYTATVDDSVVGGVTYTNTATLTGSSLANGTNDPAVERVLTRTNSSNVGVAAATVTKTVSPDVLTFGERATFTVVAVFPEQINFYNTAVIDTLPAGFDPATVVLDTDLSGCTQPDGQPCGLGAVRPLTPAPGPDGSTVIGWGGGDLPISGQPRTITVVYSALLSDATAPASLGRGDELVNAATARWDIAAGNTATSVTDDFDRTSSPPATATATVTEPELSVSKAVSDETPGPADPFTYTVTVTNSSGEFVSDAHDVLVVDDVPRGVVVSSVGSGGQYVPLDPAANGGGTITWTLTDPIPPGDTVTLTYEAVLAPSATIDATPLTNTALVDDYATVPEGTEGRRSYPDRDPSSTATVTPQFPSLVVTKSTPDGDLAYIDSSFRWRVTVTNSGGAVAENVVVTDTLPPNWTYVDGSLLFTVGGVPVTGNPNVTVAADADGNETTTIASARPLALQPNQTLTAEFSAVPRDDGDVSVVRLPGVGSDTPHVNSVAASAEDASGATGNADGPYADDATADARIDSADLAIEKTPDPGFPVAGESFTWTLSVSNLGPDDARGFVSVVDTLPRDPDAPLTDPVFVSATGDGWSCLPVGPLVDCEREMANPEGSERPFVAGTSEQIEITVAVPADVPDGTQYVNAAAVSSRTYDPDLGNNDDQVPATVQARADLQVEKALSGALVAGEDATYTLDVRNNGPSLALGPLVVSDDLPAGATLVAISGAGWVCDAPADVAVGGTATCTRDADLEPNTPAGQISVTVAIPAEQTADVVNTARVCVDSNGELDGLPAGVCVVVDPDLDNNTDEVTTTPTTLADLSLEKLREPADAELVAGEQSTYRFIVGNAGPSVAQADVTITDLLPLGISLVDNPTEVTTPEGTWTCATVPSGERFDLTCTLGGPLLVGAQTTLDLPIAVSPSLPDGEVVENEATVTSPTTDPDTSNNTDTDTTASSAVADLVVVKTHTPEPATAGGQVTFSIEVRNDGPSDASAPVTVTDAVPAAFTLVSVEGSDATYAWDCDIASNPLVCTLTDAATGADIDLAALTDAPPITLVADIDPSAGPATITNTATVDSPTTDPQPDNNSSTDRVQIVDLADITVTKTTTGDNPVLAGETTQFTLQVSNAGPSTADGVSLTDNLPAGLVVDAVDAPAPWSCTDDGTSVDCSLGEPLSPGDAPVIVVTARVRVDVPDGATLTNDVSVSTATDQGENLLPDTDSSTVDVLAEADLVVEKLLVPPPSACTDVCAGEQVDFTIDPRNLGPSSAQPEVLAVDTLPAGVVYTGDSDPADAWECTAGAPTPTGQVVTCVLTDGAGTPVPLPPVDPGVPGSGQAPLLTLSALVSSDAALGTLTNAVAVQSETTDPVTENNDDSADVVVQGLADLSIVKTHTPEPATAGRTIDVTFTVTNDGPSDADATADDPLIVRDALPEGLSYVDSTSDDGWTCSEDPAGTVICTDEQPLAAGDTETITVTLLVDPAAGPTPDGEPIRNAAEVCPDGCLTPDPDPDNNTSTDEIVVVDLADVTIEKETTGDDPVRAGESTDFTLTVTNDGPSVADDVSVTDTAPAGLVPESASGDGWTCLRPVGQQVTCTLDDPLPPGESRTIVVVAAADPDAALGEVTNTAVVSTSTPQGPNPLPDAATSTVEIVASADLEIVKALSGDLIAGERAAYTLDVTNLGPSTARADLVVTDTLPDGAGFVSATGVGWSCSEDTGEVSCVRATDLLAGASAGQITLVVDIASAQADDVVNTATVESTVTPDDDLDNNTSLTTDPVTVEADLILEKESVQPPDFIVGQNPATYRFTTLNAGPSDAVGPLTLTDLLPQGLTFNQVVTPSDGWTCTGEPLDSDDREPLTCTRPDGLTAGSQTSFAIEVAIDPNLGLPSEDILEILNTATVSSPTTDPNEENNTNDDLTTAPREADLAIAKSHSPEPVLAGETLTFSLQVTNLGLSTAARPVVVTDALPDAFAFDSFGTTTGWECSHDGAALGGLVRCVLGTVADGLDLLRGQAPPIQVVATVDPSAGPATVTNRASVSSATPDPVLSNNVAEDPVTVDDVADITVVKTSGSDEVLAGETVDFTLQVSNDGPSAADSVRVRDQLPPGMTTEAIDAAAPWECSGVGTALVDCELTESLLPGDAPAIVITAREATGTPDGAVLTNTVRVTTSTDQGENLLPDEDSSTVEVRAEADLALTKTLVEPTGQCAPAACAGEQVEFTVAAANNGPSDAVADVAVLDSLPAGLTPVSAQGSADGLEWECAVTGQDVECVLVDSATGTAAPLVARTDAPPLTLRATVDSDVSDSTLTNEASVSSPTTDVDETNNTDDADVPVETLADLSVVKTHAPEPATAGEQVEVTLTVTNDGPSDAAASTDDPLVLVDVLPNGLTYVSSTSTDGWTCDEAPAGAVTCTDTEPLPAGVTEVVTLTLLVDPSAGPAIIANTAEVCPDGCLTPDPDPDNNSSTDEITVADAADVAIAKATTGTDPVLAGETTEFTVTVTNNGPSTADDVTVTEGLPAGLAFIPGSLPSGDGWTCGAPDGRVIACTLDDPLLPTGVDGAEPAVLTVPVRVLPSVLEGTTLTNQADVTTSTPGDDETNNTATADVLVSAEADLALTKDYSGAPVLAGTTGVFTITVTNDGPSDAQPALEVVDTLPPFASFVAASEGWTCTTDPLDPAPEAGQTVTCVQDGTDPLVPGDSVVLELEVLVDPAAPAEPLSNSAEVCPVEAAPALGEGGLLTQRALGTCPTTDPNLENNTDTAEMPVEQLVDLGISKSHSGPVRVGDPLTFTLEVTNAGPSTATAVTVTDLLPPGLTQPVGAGVGGAPWACVSGEPSDAGTEVTCTLADPLPPGETSAISLTVLVGPEAYPSATNAATVTTATPESTDPDELPDTATDVVDVPAQADLAITKTHDGDFTVGETGEFAIVVTNNGPTPDPGPITVTDRVPVGLTPIRASGSGWDCAIRGQQVTCVDADGLAVDESSAITLTVDVFAEAAPSVRNSAGVSSPAEDTDASNDGATDEVTVLPAPTGPGGLPSTGADLGAFVGMAAVLVAAGVAALVGSGRVRRRGGVV